MLGWIAFIVFLIFWAFAWRYQIKLAFGVLIGIVIGGVLGQFIGPYNSLRGDSVVAAAGAVHVRRHYVFPLRVHRVVRARLQGQEAIA